jgi:hypothetical protein
VIALAAWHWSKVASEVARLLQGAGMDRETVKRIAREEGRSGDYASAFSSYSARMLTFI